MAVPKKRTSKSKKSSRLASWNKKVTLQVVKSFSLMKSILSGQAASFYLPLKRAS